APLAGALRCMVCGRESAWLLPPRWRVRRVSPESPHDHARATRRDSPSLFRRALEGRHDRRGPRRPPLTPCAPPSRTTRTPSDAARAAPAVSIRTLPFIRDTLAQYPRLRATRLFEMVRSRGYTGSV